MKTKQIRTVREQYLKGKVAELEAALKGMTEEKRQAVRLLEATRGALKVFGISRGVRGKAEPVDNMTVAIMMEIIAALTYEDLSEDKGVADADAALGLVTRLYKWRLNEPDLLAEAGRLVLREGETHD
ncbi:hypothetical protein LCGC14_1284420 [marine sediment metagenome]|uniref:Uncharacterized protein n=1 Tax=marine sediment metagenome TaxID=412755 RepID=A0A0F9LFB4_9ZZZZ